MTQTIRRQLGDCPHYVPGRGCPLHGETCRERTPSNSDISAMVAEIDADENAEWTKEITIARRAAWNAEATIIKTLPKSEIGAAVCKAERRLGFQMETLKKHIARHGL